MKPELEKLTAYLDHAGISYRVEQPVDEPNVRHVVWQEVEKSIRVSDYHIACAPDGKHLAWVETDDYIYCCLKISDGRREVFSWIPESYNLWYGMLIHLIAWKGDSLVLIYREQHRTYICTVRNNQITLRHFRGHRLAILEDRIFFLEEPESEIAAQVSLPALDQLPGIPLHELESQGVRLGEVAFTNF
nr:hypothetical protein [Flavilitoribacter sp.]